MDKGKAFNNFFMSLGESDYILCQFLFFHGEELTRKERRNIEKMRDKFDQVRKMSFELREHFAWDKDK